MCLTTDESISLIQDFSLKVQLARPGSLVEDFRVFKQFNDSISTTPYQFDFIIENERGIKIFGIPLFSHRSLLPIIDPSNYQNINGKRLTVPLSKLENYPLPDSNWEWEWSHWYVYMYKDVDPHGWMYSNLFFQCDNGWKGKYYFGNTIRKRVWIRLRKKR